MLLIHLKLRLIGRIHKVCSADAYATPISKTGEHSPNISIPANTDSD